MKQVVSAHISCIGLLFLTPFSGNSVWTKPRKSKYKINKIITIALALFIIFDNSRTSIAIHQLGQIQMNETKLLQEPTIACKIYENEINLRTYKTKKKEEIWIMLCQARMILSLKCVRDEMLRILVNISPGLSAEVIYCNEIIPLFKASWKNLYFRSWPRLACSIQVFERPNWWLEWQLIRSILWNMS